jgi:cell wall assembly regulator SMI1
MEELWTRLEAWALNNAGKSLGLRPGATEEAIAAAEQAMGLTFPPDYRASLLAHDGQEGRHGEVFEWLPGCSPLKPLAQVVERYKEEQGLAEEFPDEEQRAEGPLHTVLWHPKRIPIAGNEWWDGDNTYVDLHPTAEGTPGQIITFVTECDLVRLGTSLADAIESYLAALESGDWVFAKDKEGGHVTPKGEPAGSYPNESDEFATYVAKLSAQSRAKVKPIAPAKATRPKAKPAKPKPAKPKPAKPKPAKPKPAKPKPAKPKPAKPKVKAKPAKAKAAKARPAKAGAKAATKTKSKTKSKR